MLNSLIQLMRPSLNCPCLPLHASQVLLTSSAINTLFLQMPWGFLSGFLCFPPTLLYTDLSPWVVLKPLYLFYPKVGRSNTNARKGRHILEDFQTCVSFTRIILQPGGCPPYFTWWISEARPTSHGWMAGKKRGEDSTPGWSGFVSHLCHIASLSPSSISTLKVADVIGFSQWIN